VSQSAEPAENAWVRWRLATGVGGLDWKDVKPLLEKHLGQLSIPVYVYGTYHPGVQAAEKG
jgi:hypothetical protein